MENENTEVDGKPLEYRPETTETDIFTSLLRAKRKFGGSRTAIIDVDETPISYSRIVQAAFALGSALKKVTKPGEVVGVMLPTGAGSVIAFYALQAIGRIPAMLNFTSGLQNMKSALKTAEITQIVTAHKFIELGELENLETGLSKAANLIYLEDVRENLGLKDKLSGLFGPILPFLFRRKAHHNDRGVILFTSGTESTPKGVVLSHKNILVNVHQVLAHIALKPESDSVFNSLPIFHCFGLTVGSILPIVSGVRAIFHPSPLQPKLIVQRIREHQVTIMLSTDTFMNQYGRAAAEKDLASIRLAVCGAERVRDETRQFVRRKFNIEILEGYGLTEAAPVVAANAIGRNKTGTVGQLMKGIEYQIEPVEGIAEGGQLVLRGPNVMLGYYRAKAPGVLEAPKDGWHPTGDIVAVDDEGYIRVQGRVKRFANIGGELVSLAVVENCASSIWTENTHAAVVLPDKRKGEQIVLVTDSKEANISDIIAWAKNHGVAELAIPRQVFLVKEVPILGTGKLNYGEVEKLARTLAEKQKSKVAKRTVTSTRKTLAKTPSKRTASKKTKATAKKKVSVPANAVTASS